MKAYLITTAVIFALLTLAHIWRGIAEGPQVAAQLWFILITLASAALCIWAVQLLRRWRRS